MGINDIIFEVNRQLTKEELEPIEEAIKEGKVAREAVEEFCQSQGLDRECLYMTPVFSHPFVYVKFPLYASIYSLDMDTEEQAMFHLKRRLEILQSFYEQKQWDSYLYAVEGPCATLLFNQLFAKVGKEEQYELLRDFYVKQNHGHIQIKPEIWQSALANRPKDYTPNLPDDEEEYIVYRGSGSKSIAAKQALSWSLNPSVAIKFAARDQKQAYVLKARVQREDILEYISECDEEEVWVKPERVQVLEVLPQRDIPALLKELKEKKILLEYGYYRNSFLKKEYFLQETDGHGTQHAERVLLLGLTMAYLSNLSKVDRAILANAALYHDIGRTHDGEDEEHGQESVEQAEELELFFYALDCLHPKPGEEYDVSLLESEEEDILKRIMIYHSRPDEEGKSPEATTGLTDKGKETYLRLYSLFKDADALDRLRFLDLDPDYLRTPLSKELLTFALELQRN